jgi:glutathione peroxidase
MRAMFITAVGVALVAGMAVRVMGAEEKKETPAVLQYSVKDIDGKDVNLSQYEGKVLLIVNVASKCGNTPQYKQLEETYKKYHGQGFEILGFPANDFGKQEPGSEAQIKEFCTSNYSVDFPMFSKVVVKGPEKVDLYKYLTENAPKKGEVTWNFEKFLIGKDGKIAARFAPKTKPDAPEVVKAIETELKK